MYAVRRNGCDKQFNVEITTVLYIVYYSQYLTNIKHFPLYQNEWNWENEKLYGNTTPEGRSVFIQFRVFPTSTSVDITTYKSKE